MDSGQIKFLRTPPDLRDGARGDKLNGRPVSFEGVGLNPQLLSIVGFHSKF